MNAKKKKPELLAPAGNLQSALVAYKSGADAVYAGFKKFNARDMAENFSNEDMKFLGGYAKNHGKKYYLTLNTLIKQTELPEVIEFIEEIAALEPDGILVQDLGVLYVLRKYFPWIPIHASTQMGIHNSAGLHVAHDLGLKRVILERQVTLEELSTMALHTPVELEVFVHGALCCSLSGHCFFSSWIGSWSGNRGRCKQPCRRRYHSIENKDGKKSGFYFNTKDLYMLDHLQTFIELGIASLKIEGRLKKADYVERVVRSYRMLLDSNPTERGKTLKEARKILSGSYGRKWSYGFADKQSMAEVITPYSIGISGQLVGEVIEGNPSGISVKVTKTLIRGDRVRIQDASGQESMIFVVERLIVGEKNIQKAKKGLTVYIPINKQVPFRGKLFRVGDNRITPHEKIKDVPSLRPRTYVDLNIMVHRNGFTVHIKNTLNIELKWEYSEKFQKANNRPISNSSIIEDFRSTRHEYIRAGKVDVSINGNIFVPAGHLKRIRREFWQWAVEEITKRSAQPDAFANRKKELFEELNEQPEREAQSINQCIYSKNPIKKKKAGTRIVTDFSCIQKGADELLLPFFCPEGKLVDYKRKIRQCIENGIRSFRVTSLFQFALLKNIKNISMSTSFPFPVTNSLAVTVLTEFPVSRIQASIELEKEAIKDLHKHSAIDTEVYRYGRPFLLATRAKIPVLGNIVDARGLKFYIEKDDRCGLYFVFPGSVLSIPGIEGYTSFLDYSHISKNKGNYATFNFYYQLI